MVNPEKTIAIPRVPEAPARTTFPFLASTAPLVASLAIWVITQSPFSLIFATLGPVIAMASLGDSHRRSRSALRRENVRFEHDCVAVIHAIDDAHAREISELDRAAPGAAALIRSTVRNAEWWRTGIGDWIPVRLGTGALESALVIEPAASAWEHAELGRSRHATSRELAAHAIDNLRERASMLEDAPIVVDGSWGIGICGSRAEAAAAASAIAVQLASELAPDAMELRLLSESEGILDWVCDLPHTMAMARDDAEPGGWRPGLEHLEFRPRGKGASVHLAVAQDEASLPRDCRIIVRLHGAVGRIVQHPDNRFSNDFLPDFLSDRQARHHALALATTAASFFGTPSRKIAERVALGELDQCREHDPNSLAVIVGHDAQGPVAVDLVREGPHVVIGGTTGSGKSELLVTWVLALASAFDPSTVNFLLVDFKGGATFAPILVLPHTVGVLTDLDQAATERAILSLRAEVSRREQLLADCGARSVDEMPAGEALPRLVIVVDEFAALTSELRGLRDVFTDLAARGRSLWIHLILCTQRPAGAISDAILANCGLRISLRVNNAADSLAVIGTADSAVLPRHPPGRALVARGEGAPKIVQWALSDETDARTIAAKYRYQVWSPHRPWLEPLPAVLSESDVPAVPLPALSFGIVDIPHEQRRDVAVFDPSRDGNLIVFGGRRSGSSTVLAALAYSSPSVHRVPDDVEGAWDAVTALLTALRRGSGPALVVIDNLDTVLGRFGPDHESAFVDLVAALAREGPRAGTTMVVTALSPRGRVQPIASLC
ncbi:MAG: FtsK/SpoIIIE domain-containing protein, partial [Terrimesophilobacter sp.]